MLGETQFDFRSDSGIEITSSSEAGTGGAAGGLFSSDKESLLLSHLNWSVPELGDPSAGFGKRTHFAARYHGRSIRHQHNDRACSSKERLDPFLLCVVKPLEFVNTSRFRSQFGLSHFPPPCRNKARYGCPSTSTNHCYIPVQSL